MSFCEIQYSQVPGRRYSAMKAFEMAKQNRFHAVYPAARVRPVLDAAEALAVSVRALSVRITVPEA